MAITSCERTYSQSVRIARLSRIAVILWLANLYCLSAVLFVETVLPGYAPAPPIVIIARLESVLLLNSDHFLYSAILRPMYFRITVG